MSKKSSIRSDRELEDLLRKISDSAEIPYSKEDWKDMESRLDQLSNPSSTGSGKKGLIWAGVVFLLVLLSLATWTTRSTIKGEDQIEPELNMSEQTGVKEGGELNLLESNTSDVNKIHPDAGEKINPSTALTMSDSEGTGTYSQSTSSGITDVHGNSLQNLGEIDAGNLEIPKWKRQESFSFQEWANPMPTPDFKSSIPVGMELKNWNPDTGMHEKTEKSLFGFAGRFSLSIQAAPDLSGVEMNQVEKAGQAFGVGVSYFIKPRLSVSSGVFYSFKPYSSDGENQSGYGNEPNRVFGECDILDIPINLRYYPIEGKVQRVFASVGLSSYLMLEEYYQLEYQDPVTGYPYIDEISVSGANNHFLGVVNISAGYERKLGKQLSLQVEPYFKIPINGLGEGNISLKSTGIFVGLNFYPGGKLVK